MTKINWIFFFLGCAFLSAQDCSPVDESVYFMNLKDGQTVKDTLNIKFGVHNMGIAPAGLMERDCGLEMADDCKKLLEGTGHFHLLVNPTDRNLARFQDGTPIGGSQGAALNKVEGNLNLCFARGEVETCLDFAPGDYRVQLVFVNTQHISFSPTIISNAVALKVP